MINSVAAGAYQIGLSDLSVMVKFNAINPSKALTAYYVYFDETPICLVSLVGKNPIRTAADLNGKRVAAPAGSAIVSTMPILLKATGQTNAIINFINTSPELMPTMLLRGEADAIGGFTNSMIMGIRALGVKSSDLAILKYSDAGIDMYGLSLMSSQTFVRDTPNTLAASNRATTRAIKDTTADPRAANAIVRERDPLLDAGVEPGAPADRAGPGDHQADQGTRPVVRHAGTPGSAPSKPWRNRRPCRPCPRSRTSIPTSTCRRPVSG